MRECERSYPMPQSKATHEESDVFIPGILAFLVIVAFGGMVIHAGLWGWVKGMKPAQNANRTRASALIVPKLQISPQADFQTYREEQEKLLSGYAWVDRGAGVARIPIQKAIQLVAELGMPRWGTNGNISAFELQKEHAQIKQEGGQ